MSEHKDTIAGIIAEKRRRADEIERDCAEKMKRGEMVSDCYARELVADIRREADRLETALVREKAEVVADALAVGGVLEASRATAEKSSTVGNAAKLREALQLAKAAILAARKKMGVDNPIILEIIDAAFATPPRNCDVGTAEAQAERFYNFCAEHSSAIHGMCNYNCPCIDSGDKCHCLCKWVQMPYKKGGAK